MIDAPNVHAVCTLVFAFSGCHTNHTNTAHHRHDPSSRVVVEHGCTLPPALLVPKPRLCFPRDVELQNFNVALYKGITGGNRLYEDLIYVM
jgi:hypothetical protein